MTKMLSEILEEPVVLARLENENKDTLVKLGGELRKRNIKHVTFAARGTSDHASVYGQYLLSIVGNVNAGLAVPSCISLYNAEIDYSDSLVIAVSQSGSAADALAVLEDAAKGGALTLAITNNKESKLAKAADMHLFCCAGEEKSVAATKTFTAEMGLLYLLTAYWFEREDMKKSFSALSQILSDFINSAKEKIGEYTIRYRYIDNGFAISRGICYPVALETMLKVQETCYIKLKGYSAADFYHGPMAQADAGTPAVVYALKGAAEKDNLAVADKLISIGAEPLIVTDDTEIAGKYPLVFTLTSCDDELLEPIVAASFAQLFAESLCTLRKGNPDNPRNLKKVTVTR